jgi:RNA polymerase sigma-70 factor (ECF subfamily)
VDVNTADLELAARCATGDGEAFEQLYRRHAGRLFNLARRMMGTTEDAEDVLQNVFLQAHRTMDRFRGDASIGTWLYRLTINQCLDQLRGRRARDARVTDSLDAEEAPEPALPAPAVPTVVNRMDLERAIEHLPPGSRAVFLLHDVEGFEHGEIGRMLGISEGTSKSQAHKARLKLRTMLTR